MRKLTDIDYCYMKFVQAMLFSNDDDKYIDEITRNLDENNFLFFQDLRSYMANYFFEGYISPFNKERLIYIFNSALNKTTLGTPDVIIKVKNLLLDIKRSNGKHIIDFYRQELAIRKNDPTYLDKEKIPYYLIEAVREELLLSLENDYTIAYTHSRLVSDEDFVQKYEKGFSNSLKYLESIRSMNHDKEFFESDLFVRRVLKVLNNNVNNTRKIPLNNIKFIRENKQLIKKLSR